MKMPFSLPSGFFLQKFTHCPGSVAIGSEKWLARPQARASQPSNSKNTRT
jgi:hypothetical protein